MDSRITHSAASGSQHRLVRMPGADVEALFCLALLNTLDTRQTNAVLKRYLELFDKSDEVLAAMGRHPNVLMSRRESND